ncbi:MULTISPECIES: H-NS family nucleoid-associated regulatory protein [Stenotrophomonas]|uniref:H-NS family nucleoid-associated regulatory protein n=1 Tax=Stenotrophomonas TaxID=40323 RepID=UPI0009FC64B1|nr:MULTISPECIES: H-NS family nucleoid-associated regulatory protein [Stenotrophomonas]
MTTLKSINAEIKHLEARKALVEKRDREMPKALAVLQKYASVLSPSQRRQIAKLIGEASGLKPASGSGTGTSRKGYKLGKVAPKYRLPTGEVWTGRGKAPTAFAAWSTSAQGKAWAKANPGIKFPLIGVAVTKTATKAVTPTRTAVKKGVRPAKRPVGKARKTPKKASATKRAK